MCQSLAQFNCHNAAAINGIADNETHDPRLDMILYSRVGTSTNNLTTSRQLECVNEFK